MRMLRMNWLFLLFAIVFVKCCESNSTSFVSKDKLKFKILALFWHPAKSHVNVFLPVAEELARRGHDITVVSYHPRSDDRKSKEPLPNYKDVDLYELGTNMFLDVVDLKMVDHSPYFIFIALRTLYQLSVNICDTTLRNKRLREFLKTNQKFDLIITENFNTDCFLGIVHKFKAPFLAMSSHQIMPWDDSRLGNPDEFSYAPMCLMGMTRPLNFLQRVENTVTTSMSRTLYEYGYWPIAQRLAEETFGPGVPDLRSIGLNITALMINTHSSLHGSRPFLPNIIEVGGLHIPPKINPLPSDIKKFLDDATEGVLYFNFGSMIKASSMPKDKLDMIMNVIRSIPRKVIWKWEAEELTNKPDNVFVRKWLPQFDILSE